jgi:hypothetical protein
VSLFERISVWPSSTNHRNRVAQGSTRGFGSHPLVMTPDDLYGVVEPDKIFQ